MLHILISDSSLNQSLTFHQDTSILYNIVLRFLNWRILIIEHNQLVDLGEPDLDLTKSARFEFPDATETTGETVPKKDDITGIPPKSWQFNSESCYKQGDNLFSDKPMCFAL